MRGHAVSPSYGYPSKRCAILDLSRGLRMDGKRQLSNIVLLYAARALRGFGDGFAIIVLPAYLSALGFDAAQIGFAAAAALLGTALFTLVVGLIAPRYDLRNLLIVGAALMMGTGLAFPQVETIGF